MHTKLLTFLGINEYREVTYHWGDLECATHLFPEALATWIAPTEILVMLTAEAKAHHNWPDLNARLAQRGLPAPVAVDIPSGKSEQELWEIFAALTGCIKGQYPVVLDVTFAFRSLPIVALLAAAYLRVAHTVHLERLIYGAYEARQNDRAPVFDLTPFLGLLDWVTATDQFLRNGNGAALARLLPPEGPTGSLAEVVTGIAQGLHLLRPMDVMHQAAALPEWIRAATPSVSRDVPPFASLIERVQADYAAFGLREPTDYAANARGCLIRQLRMADWYLAKGQVVHALSIAREWLPSLLCYHFGLDPMVESNRTEMEWLLNRGGADKDAAGTVIRESTYRVAWQTLSGQKRLARLWNDPGNLAKLRNDALHSGFRKNPKSAQQISEQTRSVIAELKAIALEWKLEDEAACSS